jgi:hypothetical protein
MSHSLYEVDKKILAIVKFGPPTSVDGLKPAEYYQVTIDPEKISPSGDYIRFGTYGGDEIIGWQRCAALTLVEVLGEWQETEEQTFKFGTQGRVEMMMRDDG